MPVFIAVSVILVPSSVTTSESNGFVTLTVQRIGSSDIDVLVMMVVMEISAIGKLMKKFTY